MMLPFLPLLDFLIVYIAEVRKNASDEGSLLFFLLKFLDEKTISPHMEPMGKSFVVAYASKTWAAQPTITVW